MTTQERVKQALPLAELFVQYKQRLKQIETAYPKEPSNIFRTVQEATNFDTDWKTYQEAVKALKTEEADLKVLIVGMNGWPDDDGEPRTLSALLTGYDGEQPIVVVVTVNDRNYKVYDDDGLAYKDWS